MSVVLLGPPHSFLQGPDPPFPRLHYPAVQHLPIPHLSLQFHSNACSQI